MDVVTSDGAGSAASQEGQESGAAEPASSPPAVAPNSDLPGTILSIQILRFIAALSVVIFHAHVALVDRIFAHQPDPVDHAFQVGASGVHIFFVISGFVMVYTTFRSHLSPGEFLSRRLVRIYPIYWVTAAAYVVVHLLLGTPYHLTAAELGSAALLLPPSSSMIIGPGWTLSFEMYFYICFAVALFAGLRRAILLLTIFYTISVGAGLLLGPHSALGHLTTDSLLLEFITGAWLGFAFAHGFTVSERTGLVLVLLALALFVSGFWLPYEHLPSVASWGVPSLLLVAGALAFEPRLRSKAARRLAKMGDSSYLLYLSHVLVLDLLIATPIASLVNGEASAVWLSLPLTAICVVAAAVGYELVELPLLKVMKSWLLPKRRARSGPSNAGTTKASSDDAADLRRGGQKVNSC